MLAPLLLFFYEIKPFTKQKRKFSTFSKQMFKLHIVINLLVLL